jgi:putative transposase
MTSRSGQLQAPSVSACDHRACGVGILSLPAEPSPCRGDAAGARHCRLLRTVRRWAMKFRRDYARRLKRKRASRRDIWHLDEVVVTIGGEQHWLWRAVDQDGYILDEIAQTRRDTKSAKRLLTRLLKKQGCPPRRMITDKLGSYAAARRQIMPAIEHRCTRASATGPRTLTCLCDDVSERCRAFDLQQGCSGSSPSSLPSAISSSRPVPLAPPLPPIFIASTPWRNGTPWPAPPPEPVRQGSELGLTAFTNCGRGESMGASDSKPAPWTPCLMNPHDPPDCGFC